MIRKILILVLVYPLIGSLNAQTYLHAAGARVGVDAGISYKHFIHLFNAMEVLLQYGKDDFFPLKTMPGNNYTKATVLFELHKHVKDLSHAPGLHYYLGAGGHVALYRNANVIGTGGSNEKEYVNYMAFGVDMILGVEYMWKDFPITFGVDVKPYYSFVTNKFAPPNYFNAGITIRHIIH